MFHTNKLEDLETIDFCTIDSLKPVDIAHYATVSYSLTLLGKDFDYFIVMDEVEYTDGFEGLHYLLLKDDFRRLKKNETHE